MEDVNRFNCKPHVISTVELSFKLCGREDAISSAASCFQNIAKADGAREDRKIPICGGISGLGKSRLLEEWQAIFDAANIPHPRFGALVMYFNGHAPQPVEKFMTIEASFSWRLLHHLFIEGNGLNFSDFLNEHLPSNAGLLRLREALTVIRLKLKKNGDISGDDTLNFFLGIDEYQAIAELAGISMNSTQGLLQDLLDVLGDILAAPCCNIRVFLMLAGTDLSVISLANSSKTETIRLPLNFLSSVYVESAVASVPNGQVLLGFSPVRRHLFYLGGVARWTFQYIEILKAHMTKLKANETLDKDVIENTFSSLHLLV
jgi:hypothetical protein